MAPIDGFWLPRHLRERVLTAHTPFVTASLARGRPCAPEDEGAVTARWPDLQPDEWKTLLAGLQDARNRVPVGQAFWDRLGVALRVVGRQFDDPADALHAQAMTVLPGYTGYSAPMIGLALHGMDLVSLDALPAAFRQRPTRAALHGWEALAGLPGRLRCYPTKSRGLSRAVAHLRNGLCSPLFGRAARPDVVVGYGAGNVPGTALMIGLLALATTLDGGPPPTVVVKNSRQEPIFTPIVLGALEAADPELLSCLAVLVWDYEHEPIQRLMLGRADLVIAAASDDTIAQIQRAVARHAGGRPVRFHAHGHKVSFTFVGADMLVRGLRDDSCGQLVIEIVALLAALDSVFWDQNGCLSSRVHFVEIGGEGYHTPDEYAVHLVSWLRLLSRLLPRGAWPRSTLYDRFDRYKLMETTGRVRVRSDYEDEFLVVVDERPVDAAAFQATVNDCQGRVIVVRPVAAPAEVPQRYLRLVPAANLQSLSVAMGRPGEGLTGRFLEFAEGCAAQGVTAIRTVGRAAFPQLAYSWDGLIPLDLVRHPAGRFTTIEFDAPYEQMIDTYQLFVHRGVGRV